MTPRNMYTYLRGLAWKIADFCLIMSGTTCPKRHLQTPCSIWRMLLVSHLKRLLPWHISFSECFKAAAVKNTQLTNESLRYGVRAYIWRRQKQPSLHYCVKSVLFAAALRHGHPQFPRKVTLVHSRTHTCYKSLMYVEMQVLQFVGTGLYTTVFLNYLW